MHTENTRPSGTPLYVHLPYCAAKCPYCDFYSVAERGPDVDGMLDVLLAEAEQHAPLGPRTVFLGGGTPSYLSIPQLQRLLNRLEELTGFRSAAGEVTVECNPESLDRHKVEALMELGVTRLSIGFQSLRAEVLELFGRVHDVEASWRALEATELGGCKDRNVDLIYAYPGQSACDWDEDLGQLLASGIEHLAAYNLTFEPGTPFLAYLQSGRLQKLDEELELTLFEATRQLATGADMEAYEISNYSRPGHECQHNLNYWANGDYIGIGPSAVSKLGIRRFGNTRSLSGWKTSVAKTGSALDWQEELSPAARLGETWWLGLRLERGLSPQEARERARLPSDVSSDAGERDPAESRAQLLVEQGLLELDTAGRFRLTPRGRPLADAVAREFLVPAGAPEHGPAAQAAPPT